MNDYTPTTEEVVCLYPANEAAHLLLDGTWHHMNKWEFDRWLAEVKEAERKDERSCILDKLHAERAWLVSTGNEDNIRDAEGILAAITVIKGMK